MLNTCGRPGDCDSVFQPMPLVPLCPAGPTGPTGPTGPASVSGVLGFGMAQEIDTLAVDMEAGGCCAPIPLNLPSAMMLGMSAQGSAIQVTASGKYWIDFYINRLTCPEALFVCLRRNGREWEESTQRYCAPCKQSLHGQCYMQLNKGDAIDLCLRSDMPCTVTLGSAGLTILRLQ